LSEKEYIQSGIFFGLDHYGKRYSRKVVDNHGGLITFNPVKSDFRKIGLAIAFSPTAEAMLAEAARLASLFGAELVLIHVGKHEPAKDQKLNELLRAVNVSVAHKIIWREGNPEKEILKACREEKIDLLVAGALKKEKA
jgi:nucleotide-binding universal stress UspA family protein